MIRVVLAQRGLLICRALAQLLANEDDLHVVAELGTCDEVLPAATRERPHVAIIDYTLPGSPVMQVLCAELSQKVPDCRILMILDRSMPTLPGAALARMAPKVGLLATDASPFQLVDSVRRLARGQAVLDVDIAVAALRATKNPLTRREQQVLLLVIEGTPTKQVAARLFLTDGTVRNYLSRITAKTGARTLIEAVKRAQEAGWV
jgi:two-component system response regulator DesR